MAPRLGEALNAFKKGIPGGKLVPVPGTQNLQGVSTGLLKKAFLVHPRAKSFEQLTDSAHNLQTQATKGLQNTPVRKAAPKGVAIFKTFERTFKRQYSRLRRIVH
jgi:hypothetical protein